MDECQGIHVLVVDDEPAVCETLKEYLEDFGFIVSMANSAQEAIKILEKKYFDVAIIDIRLPDMNGDILAQKVHQFKPTLGFLIHTGSSSYHISEPLHQIGIRMEHVFLKPVQSLENLKNAVIKLTNTKKKVKKK